MLYEFLEQNRAEVLKLTAQKTEKLAGSLSFSAELEQGLPLFFDQLINVLKEKLVDARPQRLLETAAAHGKEFLRLGYSLSHVVHAYGAICQAITQLATVKNSQISADEFNIFNSCLDIAIASAVSEFQYRSDLAKEEREITSLGFLAHELRNALASASVAHEMIKAGLVGTGGSTANVLEANLTRMRNLIDRSMSEIRMRADSDLHVENFRLSDLCDQILITARVDAAKRHQVIFLEVNWRIEMEGDRQFILSAISNLIQNAIKYSRDNGTIRLNGKEEEGRIIIDVRDQCGGIDESKVNELFKPFVQKHTDRSGLGLGLTIAQRAILLSGGTIEVHSKPGDGCIFTINLPKKVIPEPSNKRAVPGADSVQPDFRRRNE